VSESVLPYEGPALVRGLTAGEVFGVVVRTFGLIILLWAFYTLVYFVGVLVAQAPTGGQTPGSLLMMAAFLFTAGVALLRGDWLVRLAYGKGR
jgi:hypothetical protein